MAAGYAQASGKLGVVYTQAGPGTTNALTGIAGAFMDSIPILLLASQIQREDWGRNGHQEATGFTQSVDQLDIFRSISHYLARPAVPENVVPMLRMCLRASLGLRGPSVIDLATDLLGQRFEFEDLAPENYRSEPSRVDTQGIERLARLLDQAKRPVLLVGDRLSHIGASADLLAFCEEQQIACATVNYAKGAIPEDHPLSVGVLGQSGHGSATECLRNADLVIGFGVRLNQATTIAFNRALFSNFVQIDPDVREIGRSLPVTLGVVGDLLPTLRALRIAASRTNGRKTADDIAALRKQHATYDDPNSRTASLPQLPPRVMRTLREACPRETVVVGDTGTTAVALARHFPVYSADGFYSLYALAPMGSGLPMSLGVQVARPDAVVLDVIGDGGFLTHAGELSVAAQHRLPVVHVVVNNGLYKSISDRQKSWFGRMYGVHIQNPDYVSLARSFGCDGYLARTDDELLAVTREAVEARRPAVIEVQVDPAYVNAMPENIVKYFDRIFPEATDEWPFPRST